MSNEVRSLQEKIELLEGEVAALKCSNGYRGVRKRSTMRLLGLPLYDIALGPDPDNGEVRGHASGFIAVGDIATGVFAFGGIARGMVAVGGIALGAISLGGCSLGLLLAIGGVAVGSVALGGCAVGVIAVGGGALGYYACGGGAFGKYVINAMQQDPEAIRIFVP